MTRLNPLLLEVPETIGGIFARPRPCLPKWEPEPDPPPPERGPCWCPHCQKDYGTFAAWKAHLGQHDLPASVLARFTGKTGEMFP